MINRIKNTYKIFGPGILMATAAIGGSHLVASTQAGALFGWSLAIFILAVNFLKYPFFLANVKYTMATKKSLIEGYASLGNAWLWLFTILAVIAAVVNTAAVSMFAASLLGYFIPIQLTIKLLSLIIIVACLLILIAGKYNLLNNVSKIIMISLSLATIVAVSMAVVQEANSNIVDDFISPSPWTLASLGFIVILTGWMPAPIEISSISSIWLKNQIRETNINSKNALLDFNVGFIGTAILAIFFLALGALVLHGSAYEFKDGIAFADQLVTMYSSVIGDWSKLLIAFIAFACMFGTSITVIDGYGRAVAEAFSLIKSKKSASNKSVAIWTLFISIVGCLIILFFTSSMRTMLDFAMILSFSTTPIFAFLNYKLVKSTKLPKELQSGRFLNILSILGLIFLFGFLILFIIYRWFPFLLGM
ncbi:NRAMP family divalent metal transporter [Arcobacter porcinus]|uniref:Divalent metal cation transporter MntH n=1 Tax=Arcobacter porcinus TaxID=1935204 RepID=A0ABX2YDU6_9BACT|nr:divalent metal cation transporter [Arcobacter porcinus]OCL82114.1 Divalent metal cation transporter MntH [Arcobacter porcinus]OCL84964.1 Divalent metal cation transporter MntH [Arcobacter porcinus]OCL93159.1 Divalent metal cation transporter MntH [Arcobacter porcinus]